MIHSPATVRLASRVGNGWEWRDAVACTCVADIVRALNVMCLRVADASCGEILLLDGRRLTVLDAVMICSGCETCCVTYLEAAPDASSQ